MTLEELGYEDNSKKIEHKKYMVLYGIKKSYTKWENEKRAVSLKQHEDDKWWYYHTTKVFDTGPFDTYEAAIAHYELVSK